MPQHGYYDIGNWNAVCDRCGRAFKFNDNIKQEWTGLYTCKETCWEPRNAQDFVRGIPDNQNVPVSRIQQFRYLGAGSGDVSAIAGAALASNPNGL